MTLYGLEVLSRRIPYSRINAREATEIFIREALVPGTVHTPHKFLAHNIRLCQKIETWQTRARGLADVHVEEAAARFYSQYLDDVSSLPDLNRFLKDKADDFLVMQEEDLLGTTRDDFDQQAFPDALDLDGNKLALSYAYRPGQDEDGVTVKLPYKLAHAVDPEILEWLVPGLLEEKITILLRSLPKPIRKQLVPIPAKAQEHCRRSQTDASHLFGVAAGSHPPALLYPNPGVGLERRRPARPPQDARRYPRHQRSIRRGRSRFAATGSTP